MDDAACISAGYFHSMAVKTDGSLWSWGLNDHGQLGDGTNNDHNAPLKVADNVTYVTAGDFYSMVVKTDGSLLACGLNYSSQLGDGTTVDRSTPVKVMDGVKQPWESAPAQPDVPPQDAQAPASYEDILSRWEEAGYLDGAGGVLADGSMYYENVLYALWDLYGYPDDAGGVYFDNDTNALAFQLVNPTPERIEELRALAGSGAVFTPCKYSYNQLMQVLNEITAMMGPDSKIYSAGLGWTSINGGITGFGESGKESRVVVSIDESEFDRYSKELAERYGDMVFPVRGGGMNSPDSEDGHIGVTDDVLIVDDSGSAGEDANGATGGGITIGAVDDTGSDNQNGNLWVWVVIGAVLLCVLVFLLLRRKRRSSDATG